MSAPRFSIVIPTRNRSRLTEQAVQSILAQSFSNWEVVISDDGSTDRTPGIAAATGDDRVRYVRTPKRLSMADHFEFATQQATGDYTIALCDDDALTPDALELLQRVIAEHSPAVISLNSASYTHPDWPEEAKNTLTFQDTLRPRVAMTDSRAMLRRLFNVEHPWNTPRSNNSFCHRDVAARIRARHGRMFLEPAPDASSCFLMLSTVPSYLFFAVPVHIWGMAAASIGADQQNRRSAVSADFVSGSNNNMFQHSPINSYTVSNILAESYMKAAELVGDRSLKLNVPRLLSACRSELLHLKSNGADVDSELRELKIALRKYPSAALQPTITKIRLSPFGRVAARFKAAVIPPPVLGSAAPPTTVNGAQGCFDTITGAAAYLQLHTDRS